MRQNLTLFLLLLTFTVTLIRASPINDNIPKRGENSLFTTIQTFWKRSLRFDEPNLYFKPTSSKSVKKRESSNTDQISHLKRSFPSRLIQRADKVPKELPIIGPITPPKKSSEVRKRDSSSGSTFDTIIYMMKRHASLFPRVKKPPVEIPILPPILNEVNKG